jgi:hypothetical protein
LRRQKKYPELYLVTSILCASIYIDVGQGLKQKSTEGGAVSGSRKNIAVLGFVDVRGVVGVLMHCG